jgi:GxxExxY protein
MIHSEITHEIIGAAIQVHRELGPGEEEAVYEEALCIALESRGLRFHRQRAVPVVYRGCKLDCGYRMDVLVDHKVVVEAKALEVIAPVHDAQLLTYMKLDERSVGLLFNFRTAVLKDGIVRRVLETARHRPRPAADAGDRNMEPKDIASAIIAAAIEVHRELGPGLLRSTYIECLCHELSLQRLKFQRDVAVPLQFLGRTLGRAGNFDLLVNGSPVLVVSVTQVSDVHKLHLASLLRQAGLRTGLLLNFNTPLLKDGIHRCFSSPRPPSSVVSSVSS